MEWWSDSCQIWTDRVTLPTKGWLRDNSFCCSHIFFFLSQWVRTSALIYDSNSSASSDGLSSPEPITIYHSWRQPGYFSLIMPENKGADAGVKPGASYYPSLSSSMNTFFWSYLNERMLSSGRVLQSPISMTLAPGRIEWSFRLSVAAWPFCPSPARRYVCDNTGLYRHTDGCP